MSSAGHILDMINRIKQNRSLRKRKKFKGDNRENSYSEQFDVPTKFDFPTVSKSELEHIKVRIRGIAKADYRKSVYTLIIVIFIVALAFWFFVQNYKIDFGIH